MYAEEVLGDSINLFGDERQPDDRITYGPLILTTAPKVCMFKTRNIVIVTCLTRECALCRRAR